MTRAEEAALKAYPAHNGASEQWKKAHLSSLSEYIQGYKQAEKDTIKRAVAWLKEHANEYIVDLTPTYPEAPVNIIVGGMCWEDLKKAMEEEE